MADTKLAPEARHLLDEIDEANVRTGFRLARSLALQNAALDRRLQPACVRVMAAISYFMNDTTMRAWPGYDLLAEVTGYTYDVIDRSIRKLKATGYLRTERHAPITGGRALVHYGYGRIDCEFLDNLIADAVAKIKERKADPDQKVRVTPTPTKKSGSESLTPTFSSLSDSDILRRQEPIRNRNPISEVSGANQGSHAPEENCASIHSVAAEANVETIELIPLKTPRRRTKKSMTSAELFFATDGAPGGQWGTDAFRYAADQGFSQEEIRQHGFRFKNHHLSKANAFADWMAAWRTWMSRETPGVVAPRRSSNRHSSLFELMGEVSDEGEYN